MKQTRWTRAHIAAMLELTPRIAYTAADLLAAQRYLNGPQLANDYDRLDEWVQGCVDRALRQRPPMATIAVGRYARITNHPRTDCIGRVVRHVLPTGTRLGGCVVRVENWLADGYPLEFYAEWDEVERSTAAAADKAADRRGR